MSPTTQLKIFFLMAIWISCSSTAGTEDPQVSAECNPQFGNEVSTLLHCQQAQIDKLEQLVKNLTELVAKLGSCEYGIQRIGEVSETVGFEGGDPKVYGSSERREVEASERRFKKIVEHDTFLFERFWFISAVNLDAKVGSMSVLPFGDQEGHNKYVVVGDDCGRVYVFFRNGEVLVESSPFSDSHVTAMTSFMPVYKNEGVVVTGHSNGAVWVHRIWESSFSDERSKLHMEKVVALNSVGKEEIGSHVSILEIHYVGRSWFVLSVDVKGRMESCVVRLWLQVTRLHS